MSDPQAAQPNATPTAGPWEWSVQDHSMAILHGPDLFIDHVLSVGPCPACTKRVKDGEWKWGRCMTPTEANARLLAASWETAAERDRLVEVLGNLIDALPLDVVGLVFSERLSSAIANAQYTLAEARPPQPTEAAGG